MRAKTAPAPNIALSTMGFLPQRSATIPHRGALKNIAIPLAEVAMPVQKAAFWLVKVPSSWIKSGIKGVTKLKPIITMNSATNIA